MEKAYVLDTNVLMHDVNCLTAFDEHDVYLPIEVITELDNLKNKPGETGYNARQALRNLEETIQKGRTADGISLGEKNGGLHVISSPVHEDLFQKYEDNPLSNLIAGIAREYLTLAATEAYVDSLLLKRVGKLSGKLDREVVFVTNDAGLRLRCEAENFSTEPYKHGRSKIDLREYFSQGSGEITVDDDFVNSLREEKNLSIPDFLREKISHNGYASLQSATRYITLVKRRGDKIHLLNDFSRGKGVEDIRSRNKEQNYLFDAVLDKDIDVVAAIGKAGTGKTLVALAAAIHQVSRTGSEYGQKFDQVIVYRPTVEVGDDIGFLPGDVGEKIAPHFKPIKTAIRKILGEEAEYAWTPGVNRRSKTNSPLFEFRPINFSRGDTIDNCLVIVDEAQNLTPQSVKTIGTRMGEGSKLILTGDPFQVDHKHLDDRNNGLSVLVDSFLSQKVPFFTPVVLTEGERSTIASAFADHM